MVEVEKSGNGPRLFRGQTVLKGREKMLLRGRIWFFPLLVAVGLFLAGCPQGRSPEVAGSPENLQATGVAAADSQFEVRGFHVDLRIQVMTMEALRALANELAGFGLNTLVMEYEASYPYHEHGIISNELAYTREEIASFIAYCAARGIQVIPLQQCFGHVEYILRHDRYHALREDRKDISQICPLKTEGDSLLFKALFADMASLHPSPYIHIGGDETYLLGHCPACAAKAAEQGKSKLFVDYMKMMCHIVRDLGKIPVMWADILLKYPEAAGELPPETIFIDWNYGWKTNYFGNISALQEKGLQFWGSPALRSHPDNAFVTCWEKHFNNQRDFIPYAREAGYTGIVMTSWSTSGLYGFTWDVNYEVVDMEQIRNTYPLSGFRILLASYAKVLKSPKPLDPRAFVVTYARERFGFTPEEGEKLWKILTLTPELIINGQPATSGSIADMRDSVKQAVLIMNQLHPSTNKKEFEHLRLMLALRDHYLAFKELEAAANAPEFSPEQKAEILTGLEKLIRESKTLNHRFTRLNKGFLYDTEIAEQNEIRNRKLVLLHRRLSGYRKP